MIFVNGKLGFDLVSRGGRCVNILIKVVGEHRVRKRKEVQFLAKPEKAGKSSDPLHLSSAALRP